MKKIVMYIFIACTLLIISSCERAADISNVNVIDSSKQQVETDEQNDNVDIAKEKYTKIPDNAEESLNSVADASKELYPDAEGNWMYGYKGTEKIFDEECYVFSVYTKSGDDSNKIGVVAKSVNGDNIYELNEITGKFEKAVIKGK